MGRTWNQRRSFPNRERRSHERKEPTPFDWSSAKFQRLPRKGGHCLHSSCKGVLESGAQLYLDSVADPLRPRRYSWIVSPNNMDSAITIFLRTSNVVVAF